MLGINPYASQNYNRNQQNPMNGGINNINNYNNIGNNYGPNMNNKYNIQQGMFGSQFPNNINP